MKFKYFYIAIIMFVLFSFRTCIAWGADYHYNSFEELPKNVQEKIIKQGYDNTWIFEGAYLYKGDFDVNRLYCQIKDPNNSTYVFIFYLDNKNQKISVFQSFYPLIKNYNIGMDLGLFKMDKLCYSFSKDFEKRLIYVCNDNNETVLIQKDLNRLLHYYYENNFNIYASESSLIFADFFEINSFRLNSVLEEFENINNLKNKYHGKYAVVNNPNPEDRLNLRKSANKHSKSLGKYYNGCIVKILKDSEDFYKVYVSGQQGYMSKEFLSLECFPIKVKTAFPQLYFDKNYKKIPILNFDFNFAFNIEEESDLYNSPFCVIAYVPHNNKNYYHIVFENYLYSGLIEDIYLTLGNG